MDKCLTFDSQVKATCKAIHNHARLLCHIRRLLLDTLAKSIVSSIIARLDYCNFFLVESSDANFQRLQLAQNAVACVISGTRKYEHIRPVLCSLHWLLIEYQIKFNIAVTTFSIRQIGELAYLVSLLHDKVSVRSLRSSESHLLMFIEDGLKLQSVRLVLQRRQAGTVFLYIFANLTLSLSVKVVLGNS